MFPWSFQAGGNGLLTFGQPIPLLWRLRTTRKQQIILTALFTLAGLYIHLNKQDRHEQSADFGSSVVLVSIIWVVVVSRLEQTDVTCKSYYSSQPTYPLDS